MDVSSSFKNIQNIFKKLNLTYRMHTAKYELNREIKIAGCGENPVGDDTTKFRVRAVR